MKRILLFVSLLILLSYVWGNVEIYEIYSPYSPPNPTALQVDISEPILYVGIVNKDSYGHNVKVIVDNNGITWESGLIYLPPNTHKEKIVEIRVPIKDTKTQNVKVSLVEDGKTLVSKTIKINPLFPIDVRNVTCETHYTIDNKTEVCLSNWFDITLKSNPLARSDYIVKVWPVVKVGNKIIYDGKNDSKEVYIPYDEEKVVSFKIPINITNNDKFIIETYLETLNVTHSVEGYEKTILQRDNFSIWYDYISVKKTFVLPVVIKNIEVYKKVDENSSKFIKDFYYASWIDDNIIKRALEDKYFQKDDILPRYYLKTDPTIVILKITITNNFNKDLKAKITLNYGNKSSIEILKLNKTSDNIYYIPIYPLPKNINLYAEITPIKADLIYNKKFNINPKYIAVSPVIITNVSLPVDKNINVVPPGNKFGYVLVGKTYTFNITLKNIYNITLSGYIEIFDDIKNNNVMNYTKKIYFTIKPHETKTYQANITFYKEFNGDIKIKVVTNDGAKDYIDIVHFNAIYPLVVDYLKYETPLVKINAIKYNNAIYSDEIVAGVPVKCKIKIRNKLNKDLDCKILLEVYNKNGSLIYKTPEKEIILKAKNYSEVVFPIIFKEGFTGYTIAKIIPKNLDMEMIFSQGIGYRPIPINIFAYPIGRYSAVELLGKELSTSSTEITKVISPIYIKNISIYKGYVKLIIENKDFPVNETVYLSTNINSSLRKIILPPKSERTVIIPLNKNISYLKLNICVKDYIIENGTKKDYKLSKIIKIPEDKIIIKKEIGSSINSSNTTTLSNKSIINQTNIPKKKINNPPVSKDVEIKNEQPKKGIIEEILDTIRGVFSWILSIV